MEVASAPDDPAHLYPPTLLPTAELAVLFSPARTAFPWHRIPAAPAPASRGADMPVPPPPPPLPHDQVARVPSVVPVAAAPPARAIQSITGGAPALSIEHTNRILDFVRKRDAAIPVAEQRSTGALERFGMAASTLFRAAEPRHITLDWLVQHRVTLRDLIVSMEIAVTDLYQAHIVRTVPDLLALGFEMALLTVNRRCLNVQQVAMCFGLTYATLRDYAPLRTFGLLSLLHTTPSFTVDELLTLGVSADALLADANGTLDTSINPRLLGFTGLTPAEWVALGLAAEHVLALKLTVRDARAMGKGWEPETVASVFGLDAAWLRG